MKILIRDAQPDDAEGIVKVLNPKRLLGHKGESKMVLLVRRQALC